MSADEGTLAATRRRDPIGAGGKPHGLMELARERRLIRIAAFERQFPQWRIGMPEPVAGPVVAAGRDIGRRKRQIVSDSLIELERRKPGSRRKFRNTQGLIEMIVDIGECG